MAAAKAADAGWAGTEILRVPLTVAPIFDLSDRMNAPDVFESILLAEMNLGMPPTGNDGKSYLEDFRPQLQDLLHDPAVIEFRRQYNLDMLDLGLGSAGAE